MLKSDPLLQEYDLTQEDPSHEVSRAYAAELLASANNVSISGGNPLSDVSEKLHVVDAMIGKLLNDHSCDLADSFVQRYAATTGGSALSLSSHNGLSDRCNRLRRQGDLVSSIAQRVESSLLHRGLQPMERCTKRLKRLLELNRVLKSCLKLKFEMTKIRQADHLWKEKDPASYTLRTVDMRDFVRVSSSIAVVEDVLNSIDKNHTNSKLWLIFFILWNQKNCWHQE